MKVIVLLAFLACAGCTSQRNERCQALSRIVRGDPLVDARAALAKGDRHLLSLGGFVSSTPGIADPSSYSTQELPATTDTEVGQCGREQGMAEAYAARYNRAIVQAGRR